MCQAEGSPRRRAPFELADIIREHAQALGAQQTLSPEQGKVLRALAACRTAALGGHLDRCLDCGHERPAYNSCRNRHCPKCQALEQARWLAGRMRTLLPIAYFHVVFTLPGELSAVVLRNRRRLYNLLFRAASQTLLTLGRDPRWIGAQLGITMVLHTWTRDLRFHPHVHAIVTGGGLALDARRWVHGKARFLFPVKVLSKLFRGKMLAALGREHREDALDLPRELATAQGFSHLIRRLYAKDWVTYAKAPFAGPQQILAYLGRYTHRVALSNPRLLEVTHGRVRLRTRGQHSVTLSPVELLRRFLLHVLPHRFVRIRHYGLHASSNLKTKLLAAQQLLGLAIPQAPAEVDAAEPLPRETTSTPQETTSTPQELKPEKDSWRHLLKDLTGVDTAVCPAWGSPHWVRLPLETDRPSRAPPKGQMA